MKFLFIIFSIFPLFLTGDIMLDESEIRSFPYVSRTQYPGGDTLLIVLPPSADISAIMFITKACSHVPLIIPISSPDTQYVKHMIDSVLSCRHIGSILLVGGLEHINAFVRINPYTDNTYITDCPYGMLGAEVINSIPVSRLPFSDGARISTYCDNVMRMLLGKNTSVMGLMGHFYDADNDSVEDFLYIRALDRVHDDLYSLMVAEMLITADNMHINRFFDLSYVPLYLQYPQEDFIVNLSTFNALFSSPAMLLFWGHANALSTVQPCLSLEHINQIQCPFSGIVCLFSCLAGDISSTCLAESLLCADMGMSAVIASSSETFYQYNRFMTQNASSYIADNSSISYFLNSMRHCLLSFAGINDYSVAHCLSYSLLGLPFLHLRKVPVLQFFDCDDSVYCSDSRLSVHAAYACSINVFSSRMQCKYKLDAGDNLLQLMNIYPGDSLFITAYRQGCLYMDTAYVASTDLFCFDIAINDSIGDYDMIPECSESLFIEMNVCCMNPPSTMHIYSPDFLIIDSVVNITDTLTHVRALSVMSCNAGNARIYISSAHYNASFPITVESREIVSDSFTVMHNGPVMTDSLYCTALYISRGIHPFDSCWLVFSGNDIEFDQDSIFVQYTGQSFPVFNYAVFLKSSGSFTLTVHSRFLHDSINIDFSIAGENTLFLYDPLGNYPDTSQLRGMADSLGIKLVRGKDINSYPLCTAYIFSMGNYPHNEQMSDSLAQYILSCSDKSSIYLEGNDCLGYDKAGRILWSAFGLTMCSDGYDISAGESLFFTVSNVAASIGKDLKSADQYTSQIPLIMHKGSEHASLCGSNISQSIPLYMINSPYMGNVYYSYLAFLMNFSTDIFLDSIISLCDSQSFLIHNRNSVPVFTDIVHTPSFCDSCILSSHYIMPDSSARVLCHIKPYVQKASDSIVIMTDITHRFQSTLRFRKHAQSFKHYRCTDSSVVIYKNQSEIVLPVKRPDIYTLDLGDSMLIMSNSTMPITVKIIKSNISGDSYQVFIVTVPPVDVRIYNVLGQRVKDAIIPGIYFDNRGKFLKIR